MKLTFKLQNGTELALRACTVKCKEESECLKAASEAFNLQRLKAFDLGKDGAAISTHPFTASDSLLRRSPYRAKRVISARKFPHSQPFPLTVFQLHQSSPRELARIQKVLFPRHSNGLKAESRRIVFSMILFFW